jgi:predicted DNA-binding protein with PD1-like motif
MKSKLLHESHGQKTFALIFDTGDEVMKTLEAFAKDNRLAGSHFTAIGAFRDVTLGYFDWQKKDYKRIPLSEQVEVVSLVGDVAEGEQGEPKIHAHVVVEAHVRPTLELILTETPAHLKRRHDPETGLGLIRIQGKGRQQ